MDFEVTDLNENPGRTESDELDKDEQNWGEACGGTSSSSSTAE